MSLTTTISNAISGLRANAYSADTVSNNLANALNEGYSKRDAIMANRHPDFGGGVKVNGVQRAVNHAVTKDLRSANLEFSSLETEHSALKRVTESLGLPDDPGSLQAKLTRLQTSLSTAAARPDLPQRLDAAVISVVDVSVKINAVAETIQGERKAADTQISKSVEEINSITSSLEVINRDISSPSLDSRGKAALLDQRDVLLTRLSSLTDVRVLPAGREKITIVTAGGVSLLEDSSIPISFETTSVIDASTRVETGGLKNLVSNGHAYKTGLNDQAFQGGKLGALFQLRDQSLVEAQEELDAFAFEIGNRLNTPTVDPTRGVGDLGVLTDNGAILDPANITGMSSRLAVNITLDPSAGGNSRLLRDGLLSVVSGSPGNASMLNGLSQSVAGQAMVSSGSQTGRTVSLSGMLTSIQASSATNDLRFEDKIVAVKAKQTVLEKLNSSQSVDSDEEIQDLMTLTRAYAANAEVLKKADELLRVLLEAV